MPTEQELLDQSHLATYRAIHGPGWRWRLAHEAVCGGAGEFLARLDAPTREAARYLRLKTQNPEALKQIEAAPLLRIGLAEGLNADPDRVVWLKIMILGGCPEPEIVQRFGLEPDVLGAWKSLWFDLDHAQGQSSDWIARQVITPEHSAGRGEIAAKLQLARAGGHAAVWLLLNGGSGAPLEKAQELIGRRVNLDTKAQQALSVVPIDGRSGLRFLRLYSNSRLDEKRLELAENRLGESCRRAQAKHDLALTRVEAKRERQQRQDAEHARKRLERLAVQEARRKQADDAHSALLDCVLRDRQAVAERATASPLAQLTWELPAVPQQQSGRPVAATQENNSSQTMPLEAVLLVRPNPAPIFEPAGVAQGCFEDAAA